MYHRLFDILNARTGLNYGDAYFSDPTYQSLRVAFAVRCVFWGAGGGSGGGGNRRALDRAWNLRISGETSQSLAHTIAEPPLCWPRYLLVDI